MTVTIKTNHGTFTGRAVESIVRREYGRAAVTWKSPDSNNPDYGLILKPARRSGMGSHVLARLIWVDEDL